MPDGPTVREGGRRTGAEDAAFLRAVGERLRLLRTRRGMTRGALSRQSGVSERYIAQMEAGSGNGSILLLRALTGALGVPAAELLGEAPERPAEAMLLEQFLGRLAEPQLREARRLLVEHFGQEPAAARRERIALIGLRGAGKSTLGRRLADGRGVPFRELDREVEREAGMELREIFELHGQAGFRRFERTALERLVQAPGGFVLAAGGSIVAEPATFELLLSHCWTVWVRAAPEEHMERVIRQGDMRPMRDNRRAMDDLRSILASREALYARADAVLDTSGRSVEESQAALLSLVA